MPDLVTKETPVTVDTEDYRHICSFCAEVNRAREHNLLLELVPDVDPADFVLWETSDFVVIPGVGSLCDGYVLISPKEHVLSFGHLDERLDGQLRTLFGELERWLSAQYGRPVVAFEHGAESFRNRGGSCTDHAHMHVFPADPRLDIVSGVQMDYELLRAEQLLPVLREQVQVRRCPYLWLRGPDSDMWMCDAPSAMSQYIRRVILRQLGRPDEWDWLVFPGTEYIRRTINRFRESSVQWPA